MSWHVCFATISAFAASSAVLCFTYSSSSGLIFSNFPFWSCTHFLTSEKKRQRFYRKGHCSCQWRSLCRTFKVQKHAWFEHDFNPWLCKIIITVHSTQPLRFLNDVVTVVTQVSLGPCRRRGLGKLVLDCECVNVFRTSKINTFRVYNVIAYYWTSLSWHTTTFHLLVKKCDLLCTRGQICNKYKHLRKEKKRTLSNTNHHLKSRWSVVHAVANKK